MKSREKIWIVGMLIIAAWLLSFAVQAHGLNAAVTWKDTTSGGMRSGSPEAGAAAVADFLLEITWPREGQQGVYLMRPFELRITPRDHDANPIDTLLRVRMTARFPGEFDAASRGYFEHPFEVRGPTTIMLVPNFERNDGMEQQWLLAYCEDAAEISGQSDPFPVLPHAPKAFALTYPPEKMKVPLYGGDWHTATFTWEKPVPPDPYTGVRQKSADSTLWADSVSYTIVIANEHGTSIFSFPSDGGGRLSRKTFTDSQLGTILRSQCPICRGVDFRWYVEASDGDFITASTPVQSEFSLYWESVDAAPTVTDPPAFTLEANSPNPFQSHTMVSFQLSRAGTVRLGIVNILGETVRVLAEGEFSPGRHVRTFDATGLLPGLYFAHLNTGSGSQTRTMLLLR